MKLHQYNVIAPIVAAVSLVATFAALPAQAANYNKVAARAQTATDVLAQTFQDQGKPIGIAHVIVENAKCIAVIPNLTRAAFIFGAKYGAGLASCKTADGSWSLPAFVKITGGSWGLQVGIEATDVVLFFMDNNAVNLFQRNQIHLGGDASVAAGPVGLDGSAATNGTLKAEILSYSHSKGLYAGLAVEGSFFQQDMKSNTVMYGEHSNQPAAIIRTPGMATGQSPEAVAPFVQILDQNAH